MSAEFTALIDAPVDEVFAWHERPGAIARLLPPWQPIRVVEEPDSLADNGRAVLRLPFGLRWDSRISDYAPPLRFDDRLTSLPLPWRHVHRFEAEATGTRVTDIVETPLPARFLRRSFAYRHAHLAGDLAVQQSMSRLAPSPLTVAMTGSTGLIGSALRTLLTTAGHRVVRLVRRPAISGDERRWDPARADPTALADVDAVIHLAGATIAGRFSAAHKRLLRDSRIGPTERLAETMAGMGNGPRVLISASAVGFYGADRGSDELDESSVPGSDFLAQLVADWESATRAAESAGIRVVHVRTGIVQSPRGGTLRQLLPLYRVGLGGRLGDGSSWLPWVDIDDITDIYFRALVDGRLSGPVNAVAPNPVTSREYAATLGKVLRRPVAVPTPTFALSLLLGHEGARELALASQRVASARLSTLGHQFRHLTLEESLRFQLGRQVTHAGP